MKPATIVKTVMVIFLVLGISALGLCATLALKTRAFLADTVATEGTVIDQPSQPVVRFTGPNGPVQFTATITSQPPSYRIGQSVPVLYHPSDPDNARINSILELWFDPLLSGFLGSIFTLVGTGFLIYHWRRNALKRQLQASGAAIATTFQRIDVDTSLTMNGRNPFVIVTQWKNPLTSQIEVFKSDALWEDPSSQIDPAKKITVLVDPEKPQHYIVELPFLQQQDA